MTISDQNTSDKFSLNANRISKSSEHCTHHSGQGSGRSYNARLATLHISKTFKIVTAN